MEEILHETEHMLARGRMDLPLTLCFAAARGDDLLLQQLLRRGSDPNEKDNNGRTALVCMPPIFYKHVYTYIYVCCLYLKMGMFYMFFDLLMVSMQQHIAASGGSDHCVALLLEYGVDPNIRGIMYSRIFFLFLIFSLTSC